MDPKVCGKLLTTHRKGYGVDVEALLVDSPSGGAPAKAPRSDLADTEGYGSGNSFLWAPLMFWGTWVYIGGRSRSVDARGAHEIGARPVGVGAPSTLVAASTAS